MKPNRFACVLTASSLVAALLVAGCDKGSDGADPTPTPNTAKTSYTKTMPLLRRMTSTQFNNTVRDLFAGSRLPDPRFPPTVPKRDYSTFPVFNVVSSATAEDIRKTARVIAETVAADLPKLMGCKPQGSAEKACVEAFIDRFGARAYRRPLPAPDRTVLLGLYTNKTASWTLSERVQMIVEAVLQSPRHLYIDDTTGTADPTDKSRLKLDGYALANRLSYLLWNTMPDAALLAKAKSGELLETAALMAEARRLLSHARSRPVITSFHVEYLKLAEIDAIERDAKLFPQFSKALVADMVTALRRFVDHVVWTLDGRLSTLLTSRVAFVNKRLDAIYGTKSGSTSNDDWRRVTLPVDRRAGLLTRAAFTANHSTRTESAPIHRGTVVLERFLCMELEPPPNVNALLPTLKDGESPRQRLARHRADPACSGCHVLIDPVGFSMEHYDAIGRYQRSYPNGVAIDATGAIPHLKLKFKDVLGLSPQLGANAAVARCYVDNWFRYVFGRTDTTSDIEARKWLHERFRASGGDIRELLVAIVTSDAFRYRPAAANN